MQNLTKIPYLHPVLVVPQVKLSASEVELRGSKEVLTERKRLAVKLQKNNFVPFSAIRRLRGKPKTMSIKSIATKLFAQKI
jgi:hypothetical protein